MSTAKPITQSLCLTCFEDIVDIRIRSYCSSVCRNKDTTSPSGKREIICCRCSKAFQTSKSNQKYCSKICSKLAFKENYNSKSPPREITCPGCNIIFITLRPNQKYCKVECRNNVGQVTRINQFACSQCQKIFTSSSPDKKYCSNECYANSKIRKREEKYRQKLLTIVSDNKVDVCYYCGQIANSVEHIIPKCVSPSSPTIMACIECNALVGAYLGSLDEKLVYLKRQLKCKYSRVLAIPDWRLEELDNMSSELKEEILIDINTKHRIIERLLWIPDVIPESIGSLLGWQYPDR